MPASHVGQAWVLTQGNVWMGAYDACGEADGEGRACWEMRGEKERPTGR